MVSVLYLFLWIIYYKQIHNISILYFLFCRNRYHLMFVPISTNDMAEILSHLIETVKFSFRWLMIDLKYPLKLFVKDPIGNKLTGFHGLSSLVDSYQHLITGKQHEH